jgi:prepilin-type N-terminal cleavage/methylation domain-containing protein
MARSIHHPGDAFLSLRRGFTLIELVIVIAIIGILASLAVPKFIDMSSEAKIASAKAGLGTLRAVLATRYAASATGGATASYPTALAESDFTGAAPPLNPLCNQPMANQAVVALTATESGTQGCFGNVVSFWYVSLSSSSDYGKAGAFSDGVIDTSGW